MSALKSAHPCAPQPPHTNALLHTHTHTHTFIAILLLQELCHEARVKFLKLSSDGVHHSSCKAGKAWQGGDAP